MAADDLIAGAIEILTARQVPAADAHLVADSLLQADLWTHQPHGLLRLP
jgi:LDH2 family malate/lactate/ureidoglycolate dehydrogenase